MKLSLHPDPGTGHYWRITLEIGDHELTCDVAERGEPGVALAIAERVAFELNLEADGPDAWRSPR